MKKKGNPMPIARKLITAAVSPVIATLFTVVLPSSACAQMRMGELPPGKVEMKSPEISLPMELFGGRVIVNVMLSGKGPFRFILDTGAAGSLIGADLTEELKLPVVGEAAVGSPAGGQPLPAKLVKLDQLSIGNLSISDIMAVSLDMSQLFHGKDAPRGVLSPALFSGLLLSLDYPQKRVVIRPGELPAANQTDIFDYNPSQRLPRVKLSMAGLNVDVDIDSGSPGSISLPLIYSEQLPLASKPVEVGRIRTVDADLPIVGAKLNGEVKLGRYVFTNPDLTFADKVPVGNIGFRFLQQFTITLDRKNHRVRFN